MRETPGLLVNVYRGAGEACSAFGSEGLTAEKEKCLFPTTSSDPSIACTVTCVFCLGASS